MCERKDNSGESSLSSNINEDITDAIFAKRIQSVFSKMFLAVGVIYGGQNIASNTFDLKRDTVLVSGAVAFSFIARWDSNRHTLREVELRANQGEAGQQG